MSLLQEVSGHHQAPLQKDLYSGFRVCDRGFDLASVQGRNLNKKSQGIKEKIWFVE
jgi:hypothetical protein